MPADQLIAGVRFGLVVAVVALALMVLDRRRNVVARFLGEESTALNLAVARVVVMGVVLWETRLGAVLEFATLDRALMVAPRGWEHLAPYVPLAVPVVVAAYVALVLTATLGLLGFSGRAMCGLTAVSALYLHTIPQLFGKVNHTVNHLVLFCALLAVAPSCDALSIDAVRSAVRDADRGFIRRIGAARAYAVPLQAMMLYIGLAYFFPGAWKVARVGTRWFSGDNMRLLILTKLQEFPMSPLQQWVIGHAPLLAVMSAVTIVFELGFVFAILDRRLRPAAALVGVTFHQATALVLGIWFTALQACYVVFIDWTHALHWLAARRHLQPIALRYDAADAESRRFVAVILAFDWCDLVRPEPVEGHTEAQAGNAATDASRDAEAAAIAERIPPLWPFSRSIRVRGVRVLGRVLARGAGRRAVGTGAGDDHSAVAAAGVLAPSVSPALRYAAAGLVGAFALAGSAHVVRTWPVACYPTFDIPQPGYGLRLSVVAIDAAGESYAWAVSFDPLMGRRLGTERWRGLVATVLDPGQPFDSARARAMIELWRAQRAAPDVRSVTFYRDTYSLTGDGPRSRIDRRTIGALVLGPHE